MRFQVRTPKDGSVFVERAYHTDADVDAALDAAKAAARTWRATPLAERLERLCGMVDAFVGDGAEIALELTLQMGRPIRYSPGEVRGFEERARTMIALAGSALDDVSPPPKDGFRRFIRREPLGVVVVLAPWNYPYLTAVNAVVPALAAGNAVLLKHSTQTPLCAERIAAAGRAAGLPTGLLQHLHLEREQTSRLVADPRTDFVCFTGSVEGGRAVHRAVADRFMAVGLELGGKDPAYVREDADLAFAIENIVDGAFFNSGQSCCGVERIYVHQRHYQAFVDGAVSLVQQYVLGDPTDPATTLGPVVRGGAARFIRDQVAAAVAAGARPLIDPAHFPAARPDGVYMAPQVLVDVHHGMNVMREETFGPVVGIMPVRDDAEALALMNDSPFGLTASIWSRDVDAAVRLGGEIETGTVFLNRCDYLDPMLAWTGVKDSGRGCTLSRIGYEHLTRPKSFHLRLP